MIEQFHFIQPLWLFALLPLAPLLWLLKQGNNAGNPWQNVIDAQLLPLLLAKQKTHPSSLPVWLLSIAWLVTVLALANPTWNKQPQAVLQTNTSRVIVLDLSRSMLASDIKPSRLARARFKVEDILAYDDEGQTGLVVFAGDAFSVTPLTRDTDTISAQLKALEPGIMPSQGSRADLGLLKAKALLEQAGMQSGQVILIADGVEGSKSEDAAAQLRLAGYQVSVLGVGTSIGASLPDGQGGTSKDGSGKPLLVQLDIKSLEAVARSGGGRYTQLSGSNNDISYLLDTIKGAKQGQMSSDLQNQKWLEKGPLLAALLLPLAALAFRRGWLLSVLLCTGLLSQPTEVMAFDWNDIWLRNDQQAAQALARGQYEQAEKLAKDPIQRGSAAYKKGDYQSALDDFNKAQGSDVAYNRGNALARLGKYQEALKAYDEALRTQAGMEDALANKAAVEALLKKQQQQNQQKQPGEEDNKDQQSSKENSSSNKDSSSDQNQHSENKAGNPSQEKQDGDGENKPEDSQNNQFADANQKMDQEKSDKAGESESRAGTSPQADKDEAQQAQANKQTQPDTKQSSAKAEKLSSEEQLAAQQWLRRIPDDPGGLLRRKFLYQYQQREQPNSGTQNW